MKINAKNVGADASIRPARKEYQKNNGITLIALVVTIIVLLILAGVSLSLVAGGNGIIGKAVKAVNETNEKAVLEEVELVIAEANMEYYLDDTVTNETLAEYLAKKFSPYTTGSGAEITFNEDGNIQYEGKNGDVISLTLGSNGRVEITGKTEGTTGGSTVAKRTVTYNANGGTGSVPSVQTAKEGNSVTVSFSPVPTKEGYTFLGWATNASATSAEYTSVGSNSFTIGTSNVTLYAVWEVALAVNAISEANYGDTVNYSANGVDDWKIFLNDGTNIYLISSDCVPNSGLNKTSGIETKEEYDVYSSTDRDTLLNWLTNPQYWTAYASGMNGATATGAPTLIQFLESFNKVYGTSYSGDNLYFGAQDYQKNSVYFQFDGCNFYWFGTVYTKDSKSMQYAGRGYVSYSANYDEKDHGVRPLVKLPAGVKAQKGSDGKWSFME